MRAEKAAECCVTVPTSRIAAMETGLLSRFEEFNLDPALVETLEGAREEQVIEGIVRLDKPREIPDQFDVISRFQRICTGRFSAAHAWAIRRHPNVVSLKGARSLGIYDDAGEPTGTALSQAEPLGSSQGRFVGKGSIVAALDFGLDFAHPNFLNSDGATRLLAFWHQGAPYNAAYPNRFGYGRVFSRQEIDAALGTSDPYEALGYHPAISDSGQGSHGTHTLDIAAGNGRAPGARPREASSADLIFVHLSTPRLGAVGNLGSIVAALDFGLDVAMVPNVYSEDVIFGSNRDCAPG